MRIAYSKMVLLGPELIDNVINYADFEYIINARDCVSYGHFNLATEEKDKSILKRFSTLFLTETVPFKEVIIHGFSDDLYERFGFYFPNQIQFYDKYPKNNSEDNVYSIIAIDHKLEIRHSLNRDKKLEDLPKAHEQVSDQKSIKKIRESFKILLSKAKEAKAAKEKYDKENDTKKELIISKLNFQKAIKIFEELGYFNSSDIDINTLIAEIINDEFLYEDDDEIEKLARKNLSTFIYPKLSSTNDDGMHYSKKCILCDYEFLDPSEEYITFMERFGEITDGELEFYDISLRVDDEGYEHLDFTVNGINKTWKLEKEGYILAEYFSYFAPLTKEFNTKGNYTFYSDDGQQFVVDYATEEEQEIFIKKTKLKRKWL